MKLKHFRLLWRRIALPAVSLFLLAVGCPHRSPIWSPDGKWVLILGGSEGEEIDKPASRIWLVPVGGSGKEENRPATAKALRLKAPAHLGNVRYFGAAWIDSASFVVLTGRWKDGEVVEGSEAIWKVSLDGKTWTRINGPPPSSEQTPLRNPVIAFPPGKSSDKRSPEAAVVYGTGSETVVAVSLASGKVLFQAEPAFVVGPGPRGGFLLYSVDEESGELELKLIDGAMKKLWTRTFSKLRAEIGKRIGKKLSEVAFNDVSTSAVSPDGKSAGVNLVLRDIGWRDGILGYHTVLSAKDGALLGAASATCLPGSPVTAGNPRAGLWAWAVTPHSSGGSGKSLVRSFPLKVPGSNKKPEKGLRLELKDVSRSSLHGYSLSPDRKSFCVVVNGPATRLIFYPVEGGKLSGKPAEVELR